MPVIPIYAGDYVKLKKPHPCGGSDFSILRVGGEVRIRCQTCNRDMTIDRIKLEKSIKIFLKRAESAAKKEGTPQ